MTPESIRTLKKTKIVATIGPASEKRPVFTELLHAGVNIARVNMSHGSHAEHATKMRTMRMVARRERTHLGVLLDLAGPKIRIGDFVDGAVELVAGARIILTSKRISGTAERVFFGYPTIVRELKSGQVLMLDDGKKKLVVERVVKGEVYCKVLVGGPTKSRRGVNLPGAHLSMSALTPKDKKDLAFGLAQGVDFVALSFVRTAKDIHTLRAILARSKSAAKVIAKIETEEAVQAIDSIIEAADGIMVARGDLAIEIGPERVPLVQKDIINRCNAIGKPVIVATQMLESMINTPVPTRAEVSDVANAIFDGADAVMLSEETALGKYPVESVRTMAEVIMGAEQAINTHRRLPVRTGDIVDSVSSSVVHNAEDVGATLIVAFSETGSTARLIARYKPKQPIVVVTPHEATARHMTLSYGCYPMIIKSIRYVSEVIEKVGKVLVRERVARKGDRAVVTAGIPFGKAGSTNMMMILKL